MEGVSNTAQWVREDYEPFFDRLSIERRVLAHVTDLDHVGRGPRNTTSRLATELMEDPYAAYQGDEDEMQDYLDDLELAGLVEKRDDGTYVLTEAGHIELNN